MSSNFEKKKNGLTFWLDQSIWQCTKGSDQASHRLLQIQQFVQDTNLVWKGCLKL